MSLPLFLIQFMKKLTFLICFLVFCSVSLWSQAERQDSIKASFADGLTVYSFATSELKNREIDSINLEALRQSLSLQLTLTGHIRSLEDIVKKDSETMGKLVERNNSLILENKIMSNDVNKLEEELKLQKKKKKEAIIVAGTSIALTFIIALVAN